ncbi:MAG: hypothetical protein QGH40_07565 [bacterium]|nr:hypothetical protein [bacterium]
MYQIPEEIIAETWSRMASMPPEKAIKLLKRLIKQQPVIIDYLSAVGEGFLNQEEREFIGFLTLVIWQTFSQSTTPLKSITEEDLAGIERMNRPLFEHLESESESKLMRALSILYHHYHQKKILKYLIQMLLDNQDEEPFIRTSNRGIAIVSLKTVIDCFSQQFKPSLPTHSP